MIRLLIAAALIVVAWPANASAALVGCFGPPADYITAFDTVRGQSQNGQVDYPYPTVFLEWQGQLTPSSATEVGDSSEHIHLGACIPEGQTLTTAWNVDARYVFHNVENYDFTGANASTVTQGGSQTAFAATSAQLAQLNTAAHASGNHMTTTVFTSYAVKAAQTNGLKELRWQVNVDRNAPAALVDTWKVSARAYVTYNYAGLATAPPLGSPDCHIDYVRTQNWITYHDEAGVVKTSYGYAGPKESQANPDCTMPLAWTPGPMATAKPSSWSAPIRTTDGTNRLFAYVDPNFHVTPGTYAWGVDLGNPATTGVLVQGGYNVPVTVPLGSLGLAAGVHRFMVQGHKWPQPPQIKPISTSIVVYPFKVQ